MLLESNTSCDFHLDRSSRTLHVHWHEMHVSSELRAALGRGLELVKKHRVEHWIADVSQVTTPTSPDDQQWIAEQGPEFIAAGLRTIITVLPSSALAKLSTKGWQRKVGQVNAGFAMVDVGSVEEAFEVVKSRKLAA